MEEENPGTFFKWGHLNERNQNAKSMVYVLHLEAARDYVNIAKKNTSKLIKIANQTPKSISQLETTQIQSFSQFDRTRE